MEPIELIDAPLAPGRLKQMAEKGFGDMVKGVVDVEKRIIALGGELHADEEAFLLENGSLQRNLWGVNLYPGMDGADFLEFDSMINIRPSQNNRSRGVEDPEVRRTIERIVADLLK
jgi:Protein of unknown function (DUF5674)